MKPEELTERLDKAFDNRPKDNIELLPKDLAAAFDKKIESKAEIFGHLGRVGNDPRAALCGAAAQGFWAGYNYYKEHGELKE